MLDRALLARYLRQRAELGERELFLDGMSAEELLAALASGPSSGAEPASRAGPTASRQDGGTALRDGGTARRRDSGIGAAGSAAAFARIREVLQDPEAAAAADAEATALGEPEWHRVQETRGRPRSPSCRPAVSSSPSGRTDADLPEPLRALAIEARNCTACRLSAGRRTVVFGEGNPAAGLVVVGEAPGQEEDRTGRPFVGQAGKLLDLLLLTAGFPRHEVYICNTLKCRPPQNRNPQPDELAACARYVKGQLGVIQPKVLLAVGKFAAQSLVGSEESISRLRGRIFRYEGIPLVVSYHPAFLLRSPQWTRTTWEDFQLARKVLDERA